MLSFLLSTCVITDNASAETPGIEIGNWWEYGFSDSSVFYFGEPIALSFTGSVRMNITSESTTQLLGGSEKVFMLKVTGISVGSGSNPNTTVSETQTITGNIARLASNFSLVWSDFTVAIVTKIVTEHPWEWTSYWNTSAHVNLEFAPAFDDYVGDSDLETFTGSESKSSCHVEVTQYDEPMDETTVEEYNEPFIARTELLQSSTTTTVPAGTFECSRFRVNETVNESSEESFWYYSKAVGNYLKFRGTSTFGSMLGDGNLTLKAYSYSPPSMKTNLLSEPYFWIAIAAVAAVASIAAVGLIAKKKRYRMRGY